MDGVMQILAKKTTQRNEDLFFNLKFVQHKQFNYYAEVTPMTSMLIHSADILDPFCMLQSLWKRDKVIDIIPEDETSYTTQYQQAFLKCVEHEYCAKHRQLSVI